MAALIQLRQIPDELHSFCGYSPGWFSLVATGFMSVRSTPESSQSPDMMANDCL
jgi:hypothetical protein